MTISPGLVVFKRKIWRTILELLSKGEIGEFDKMANEAFEEMDLETLIKLFRLRRLVLIVRIENSRRVKTIPSGTSEGQDQEWMNG